MLHLSDPPDMPTTKSGLTSTVSPVSRMNFLSLGFEHRQRKVFLLDAEELPVEIGESVHGVLDQLLQCRLAPGERDDFR
jgi:hypothetical protein